MSYPQSSFRDMIIAIIPMITTVAFLIAIILLIYLYLGQGEPQVSRMNFTPIETIALMTLIVAALGHIINFTFAFRSDRRAVEKQLEEKEKQDDKIRYLEIENAILKTKLEYETLNDKKKLSSKDYRSLPPKKEE